MKPAVILLLTLLVSGVHASCYALSCNCDDWIKKGGYCVDYVKTRIDTFPIPYKDDMPALKNIEVGEVTEGDVAVFKIKTYWHVAYVERVHRNPGGEATAIDVTEMNFGDPLSFAEFRAKWKSNSRNEWNRATCCGVTDDYGEISSRRNVDLSTVTQVWSPDDVVSEGNGQLRIKRIVDKVRKVIQRLLEDT